MRRKGITRMGSALAAAWTATHAMGQLAITEVHSNASTNGTPSIHADWWELTNYGPAPVNLAGYRFNEIGRAHV